MTPPKVDYRSKADLVAEAIKDMVRSRELLPGSPIRQREMASRLGVSPTPVREALRRLEVEGYVASEPHQAPVVVWPQSPDIYEIAIIRGTLEGLGAELAAKRVTPSDIADLQALNEELAGTSDQAEIQDIDRRFHARVCEVTRSPALLAQLNLVWGNLKRDLPDEDKTDRWVTEHEEIIRALSDGDCSEARDTTKNHVLAAFKSHAPSDERSENNSDPTKTAHVD